MATDDRFTALEKRVAALELKISNKNSGENLREVMATNERVLESTASRLAAIAGLSDKPQFYVGVSPTALLEMPDLFESSSEASKLFENPAFVRDEGFKLYPADQRSAVAVGLAREVKIASQARRISRDGRFVAIFPGDDSFLGWAMYGPGWPLTTKQMQGPLQINSLVLIEATYNAVTLGYNLLRFASSPEPMIQYSIGLKHMKQKGQDPLILNGKADIHMQARPRKEGDLGTGLFSITPKPNESPEHSTFRLVAEVFRRFGIPDDLVPYTLLVDGVRQIDPTSF